jgi:predicted nucleic acid-binding protein
MLFILSKMEERQDQLCTSSFAAGEVMVGPYKTRATAVTKQIREFFESSFVEVIPYTLETADLYAQIRADHGVSPPDAIHLACAAQAGTDLFLTNDSKLTGKVVPGIQFITGMDTNLF